MIKKVSKMLILFFLLSIFILCNFTSVKAMDSNSINTYSEGDSFVLVKDAYKYLLIKQGWWKVEKVDPDYPDFYFKKGDIVKYTGKYETNVDGATTKHYMEFSSGKKKGLIRIENVEPYKTSRPATIDAFISTYGVSKIKDESQLNQKISEYKKIYKDSMGYPLDMSQYSISSSLPAEQRKIEYENAYQQLVTSMSVSKDDSAFMAAGYKYAWEYQVLINKEKDYGDIKEGDWAAQFDKAYKNYKNAGKDDSKRSAAIQTMQESYPRLTDEETKTKIDGDKTRRDVFNQCVNDETDRKVEQEKEQEAYEKVLDTTIYKSLNVTTSEAGSGIDDAINDADDFLTKGGNNKIDTGGLQNFSGILYNILLQIGVVIAVIAGLIIGIRFMMGGVEEKADIKQILIPYIAGCVVVFGGFGIWKLVVTLLQNV